MASGSQSGEQRVRRQPQQRASPEPVRRDWETYMPYILQKYQNDRCRLSEVMAFMEREYNFTARLVCILISTTSFYYFIH